MISGALGVIRTLLRRRPPVPRTPSPINLPARRLGTPYGGYAVIEHLLDPNAVVYSFGIGEDISFDLELIRARGCQVHAFDPTPRVHEWLATQQLPAQMSVHPFGLSDHDGVSSFTPPANPAHVSLSVVQKPRRNAPQAQLEVRTLATLMKMLSHSQIDVLKMDIEGAEYAVIEALAAGTLRPGQILVEFHHLQPGITVAQTERALATLTSLDYSIFDIQPGHCEFSLIHHSELARAQRG